MSLQKYQCHYCKKDFYKPDWRYSKYCNPKCFYLDRLGKPLSEKWRRNIKKGRRGIRFSDGHIENLSLSHKGKKIPDGQKKKISDAVKLAHSRKSFGLIKGQKAWNKGKKCLQWSGKNHWNWEGGITSRDTTSYRYKEWHKAVFKYDNYTCWICGSKKSGEFVAHHLKGWKNYPKLRYKVGNGIMLCEKCHYLYGSHKSLREFKEEK